MRSSRVYHVLTDDGVSEPLDLTAAVSHARQRASIERTTTEVVRARDGVHVHRIAWVDRDPWQDEPQW